MVGSGRACPCFRVWLALFLTLALSACGNTAPSEAGERPAVWTTTSGAIQVSEVWVRNAGGMGTLYMHIRNAGATDDRLIQVESDAARSVELHTMIDNNGVMEMRPVEAINVPANGEIALESGGFHIMMIGLTRDLAPGETVGVRLHFDKSGAVEAQAEVRSFEQGAPE